MPARLNDLLASDAAARTSYLEQVWMDAELFASFMLSECRSVRKTRRQGVAGAGLEVGLGRACHTAEFASTESPCRPAVG